MDEIYETRSPIWWEEERLLYYQPSGYHPTTLGDTFKDGRYILRHKLGHGGFSTVWLAWDIRCLKWVSLKILRAKISKENRELQNFQALQENLKKGIQGSEFIVQLIDNFIHNGPNGSHQCLVFEFLGPNAAWRPPALRPEGQLLSSAEILQISIQLLHAFSFMHQIGFAHGDFSPRNLVYHSSQLSHLSERELFKILGPPQAESVIRLDGTPLEEGVPKERIASATWSGWVFNEEIKIRIIDLGEGFFQDAIPKCLSQPLEFHAPETIFTDSFDYRVDLCRVGLTVWDLIFGAVPFCSIEKNELPEIMVDFAGELPTQWKLRLEQFRFEAGPLSSGDYGYEPEIREEIKLERLFEKKLPDKNLEVFLPVIKGLTRLLPSQRVCAKEAIQWITDALRTL